MSEHLLAEANRHAKALPKKKTMSYDHITDTKKLLKKCADYRALVDRLERDVTLSRTLHERDRENYLCAIKASIAVENQLKRENAALREQVDHLIGMIEQLQSDLAHFATIEAFEGKKEAQP